MSDFVSLKQIANELGMDKSNARRYVLRCGIKFHKRRSQECGNQAVSVLTAEEAEAVRRRREEEGFTSQSLVRVVNDSGLFYIIQLIPELSARRIKLGYTDDLDHRLSQHRTAAPTAKVVASWPCKRLWEPTLIDCLTAATCKLVLNEVFECDDLPGLIDIANRLFSMLPDPSFSVALSEHSPLNT